MNRFRFRLDGVLRLRRAEEAQSRDALAAAHRVHAEHAALAAERVGSYAMTSTSNTLGYEDFMADRQRAEAAVQAITWARTRELEARARLEERRHEYAQRHRRVAALERAEGRARERHQIEFRRSEQREVDDLVLARRAHLASQPQEHSA